ncbi:MAG: carbon storage regulator CsrA [Clostridiales bacterium]|nr:carbon storage regulator CsrA [Clostridiales bacterium]
MLIITRKSGESFFIGDDIEVTVFDIGTDKVRIGIKAPSDIPIFRKEIWEIKEENLKASKAAADDKLKDLDKFLNKNIKKL